MTMRELQYAIETNTSGLAKAFPALDKLTASLERLDKNIQSFGSSAAKGFGQVGDAFEKQAKGADASAKKIEAALNRQQAATISAQQKLVALNNQISNSGADTKLITANTRAYNQLEEVLKNTSTTASEVTLAKAKYNATLSQSKRSMLEFSQAQKAADQAARASESGLLKQSNAVERMRLRYLDLRNALEAKGSGDKFLGNLDSTFNDFEKQMGSGVLSAGDFSASMNEMNSQFSKIKRSEGFARGVTAGVSELASSAQLALGPLSGIASRMTALGTLSRSTSVLVAGTVGVILAFGAAMVKSVMDGARLEAQLARINSILKTTGNEYLISGSQVEKTVRKISAATGAVQSDVREAAAGFLTIKGMNEELLESSLKASQGLALIGGGSIQTSFRNLTQALQAPAEGLNTLTQYGIKFNEAEKRRIELLVMSGNKQEAQAQLMKRIETITKSATAETDTMIGSWRQLTDELTNASQDFALSIGLIDALKHEIKGLAADLRNTAKEFKDAGIGIGYLASLFGYMEGSTGSLQSKFIKLYEVLEQTDASEEAIAGLRDKIKGLYEQIKMDPGKVDFKDIENAIKALSGGDIAAAEAALSKYSATLNKAATAAQVHKNKLDEAASSLTSLEGEYMSITRGLEDSDAKVQNINNNWSLMKEVLMQAGKSAEQAEAHLSRLRTEVELGSNSIKNFVNDMEKSIVATRMDADISRAVGAEKRKLQLQQRVLNQLWDSGVIKSSNYTDALIELRKMGLGSLAEDITRTSEAAEKADYAKAVTDMNKALDDQIKIAKVAADVSVSSARAQAEALAVAGKMQEMLNQGIEAGSAEWNTMIGKVKQLVALDFAGKWLKDFKDLENEIRMATIATDAASKSSREQAVAIAIANEQLYMNNEGIEKGTALWNQRIAAAKQLVELDFTKQHTDAMKSMQGEVLAQQRQLDFMFYSEKTKERMIALGQKEYELAQKYGSLQDARAQKELELYKIIQDRQSVVDDLKQVSDVMNNAFQSMEDSLVNFLKTGKMNFKDFANSVLEDIFRMTYKMAITDPLKDMIGNVMKGITGKGTDAAGVPSVADAIQVGTFANPAYTYVLNDMGSPGDLTDILTGGEGTKSLTDSLFGGKETKDLLRKGLDASGDSTNGIGKVGEVIRKSLDPITSASKEASSGLVDLGNGLTMTGDAFSHKMDLVAQEAAKFGDVATKSFNDIGNLRGPLDEFGSSLSKTGSQASTAVDSITKNFGEASKNLEKIPDMTDGFLNPKSLEMLGKVNPELSKVVQNAQKYMPDGESFQLAPSTLRTMQQQRDFVASGASQTMNSKHLTGDAVDLNLFKDGKYSEAFDDYKSMSEAMKKSAKELGTPLKWGGDWKTLKDGPHFEVPKGYDAGLGTQALPQTMQAPGFNPVDTMQTGSIPGLPPGGSPFAQLPQQMQMPGMPNPMGGGMPNPMGGGMPNPMGGGMGNATSMIGGGTSPFSGGMGGAGGAGGVGGSFTGGAGMGGSLTSSLGGDMGGMGGDITGQLRGSLDNLSQSVNQTSGSFASLTEGLPEVTTNLTSGLDKAADSASKLADDGLQKAASGMNQLATDTITQSVTAQAQSAASTAQMGTSSVATSASVQVLGQAALTAAAQMQGGGALGAVGGLFHTGGIVGSETGGGFRAVSGGFGGAPRLHGGLHSDEFKAILKRGEGVFTEDQMSALGNAVNRRGDPEDDNGRSSRRRGGGNVTVNLNGVKDFDSFKKSQAQLNAGVSSAMRQSAQSQD